MGGMAFRRNECSRSTVEETAVREMDMGKVS
jgi:hypothetical protein